MYLTFINIIFLFYSIYSYSEYLKNIFYSKINISFILFLLVALFSFFWSVNLTESLVKFSYWINVYILFVLSCLYIFNISFRLISFLISIFLLIHLVLISMNYSIIVSETVFNFSYANYLKGLASNKNISSALILFCLPFTYYSAVKFKNILYRILVFFISIVSFYFIFSLSARSVFLSVSISTIFISLSLLFYFFKLNRREFLSILKSLSLLFYLPLISAYIIFNTSDYNQVDVKIVNRISTVNLEDSSTNTRIRFYNHAIDYFLENPLVGVGVGNWKFKSIDYDKANIRGYIVPYHVHNDFLEIIVELGVFGFLAYLFIFLFSAQDLLRFFKFSKSHDDIIVFLLLSVFLLAYLVDANLNFPHARLIQQVPLCFFLAYIVKRSLPNTK